MEYVINRATNWISVSRFCEIPLSILYYHFTGTFQNLLTEIWLTDSISTYVTPESFVFLISWKKIGWSSQVLVFFCFSFRATYFILKNEKKITWIFLFQNYDKSWSILQQHFHTSLKSKFANFWVPLTKTIYSESSWDALSESGVV